MESSVKKLYDYKEIFDYIDSKKEEMVSFLEDIVNIESYGYSMEDVNNVAIKLKQEFEKENVKCKLIPTGSNGYTLSGILGEERDGKPIIFSGHMDTALKIGTLAQRPFKVVDGKAEGVGVLDMKGGIVISLYVIKALNSIGYNERPIQILFAGDEETNHLNSNAPEVMMKEAEGAECAFNMETGLIDNSFCVGRKGRIGVNVIVNGVEAHAGNDFAQGRSAIKEMAYKIIEIEKITNLDEGITCSVDLIKGGTSANAIPNKCEIEIDIRFDKVSQLDDIKKKLELICSKNVIDKTSCEIKYASKMMPYETTDDVMRLYNYIANISEEYGLKEAKYKKLGGSSDASYLTIAGVPTLCSCGIQGQWNHTMREYGIVDSMYERAKLFALAVINIDKF